MENYKKIIAVDFDGCLVTNKYPEVGEPIEKNIAKLKAEQEEGARVILWTNRRDEFLEDAVAFCELHEIHLDGVNENLPDIIELFGGDCRKVFANEFWDDRAVRMDESDIGDFSDGYHTFNDLYEQRLMLSVALFNAFKELAWKAWKHENGEECFGGGWFVVGIDTPAGTYTYHYEAQYWDLFNCKALDVAKPWDGHTDKDVSRLLSLLPWQEFQINVGNMSPREAYMQRRAKRT